MLSVGANDLCAELGIPGEFGADRLRECIARVAKACKRHNKLFMLGGIGDLAIIRALMPLGIAPLYQSGTDTEMMFSAAEQRVRRLLEWHTSM
jgi:2-keto-3-deoxy-L-rhamnonate aldolase RhmA